MIETREFGVSLRVLDCVWVRAFRSLRDDARVLAEVTAIKENPVVLDGNSAPAKEYWVREISGDRIDANPRRVERGRLIFAYRAEKFKRGDAVDHVSLGRCFILGCLRHGDTLMDDYYRIKDGRGVLLDSVCSDMKFPNELCPGWEARRSTLENSYRDGEVVMPEDSWDSRPLLDLKDPSLTVMCLPSILSGRGELKPRQDDQVKIVSGPHAGKTGWIDRITSDNTCIVVIPDGTAFVHVTMVEVVGRGGQPAVPQDSSDLNFQPSCLKSVISPEVML